jgi:topoisomerase-4 subunit A
MPSLEPLMRQNFLEFASYVLLDRAFPDLRDGCKPVQRRILHTLSTMDDGKFIKVANVIGECMKLHPHGDASIGDALVVLANKGRSVLDTDLGYFMERQGNFGNELTGDGAAAARYIECRLTQLAKDTLFNKALTTFVPSYDGRKEEPESLPSKLPTILLLGTEGIGVGMATTILPHNFGELLGSQIKILKGEKFRILPDFPQGGLMDASEYEDGNGVVKLRAKIEVDGDKKLIIREIPFGTTVESLIDSIEGAVEKGKVKIASISDRTGEAVEIELNLPRGTKGDEVLPQLFAYTDCEKKISSNIVVIRDRKPAELTVSDMLRTCTAQLTAIIKAELEHELAGLTDKQHALTLEQIFIENRVYKRIEEAASAAAVVEAVKTGMAPFRDRFVRALSDEDVERLLEIRIKRISAYDIAKNRQDIADILAAITAAQRKLADLTGTTIAWIEGILAKYGRHFPRRTRVRTMEEIDKKAVARATLAMNWDKETGFLGTAVKGETLFKCSEYDRILILLQNGVYKIIAPEEKILVEGKVLHLGLFDEAKGFPFTILYKDDVKCVWAKKSVITSYIRNKEYELIKDRAGKIEHLSLDGSGKAVCHLVPAKGQRITEVPVDLAKVEVCGLGARGSRITDKPVQKVAVK